MEIVISRTDYVDSTFNSQAQFLFISLRGNDIQFNDIFQCNFLKKAQFIKSVFPNSMYCLLNKFFY